MHEELRKELKRRHLSRKGDKDRAICRLILDDLNNEIKSILGSKLKRGYTFGSRLYGNAHVHSQYDFLAIVKSECFEAYDEELMEQENASFKSMDWFFDAGWFPDLIEVREAFNQQNFVFITAPMYQGRTQNQSSNITL